MSEHLPPRTHNLPPVIAPLDTDVLADLQRRYAEIPLKAQELKDAFATYPATLTLKDEATAMALQDLIGQSTKFTNLCAAYRKTEKGPWQKVLDIGLNFFKKHEEDFGGKTGLIKKYEPVLQQFLDLREAEKTRVAAELAAAQRAEAERLRLKAEAAAERARKAADEEIAAHQREKAARLAAEQAEQARISALARADAAKAEENRLADEKRERDHAEKERNATSVREIKSLMAAAEGLHVICEADEASEDDVRKLDAMVRPGGAVSTIAGPVSGSALLDDEQKAFVDGVRARLSAMREAANARFDAKEQRRREKARKAAEAEEDRLAIERAAQRQKDDEAAAVVRAQREAAEREAGAAKAAQRAAQKDAREARTDAREAGAEQKGAVRDAARHDTDADRTANRADRLERRAEAGGVDPLRGELGTRGSTTGRWAAVVEDEAALRAASGPLGEFIASESLRIAAGKWMSVHRGEFVGERMEGLVPGVVFQWERGTMIGGVG